MNSSAAIDATTEGARERVLQTPRIPDRDVTASKESSYTSLDEVSADSWRRHLTGGRALAGMRFQVLYAFQSWEDDYAAFAPEFSTVTAPIDDQPQELTQHDHRHELLSALHALAEDVRNDPSETPISETAVETAERIIHLLPRGKQLPVLSHDFEGSVVMKWRNAGSSVLLTIEEAILHFVVDATAPNARYFDEIPFDVDRLPAELVAAIPAL